jgi:hypothetical protein
VYQFWLKDCNSWFYVLRHRFWSKFVSIFVLHHFQSRRIFDHNKIEHCNLPVFPQTLSQSRFFSILLSYNTLIFQLLQAPTGYYLAPDNRNSFIRQYSTKKLKSVIAVANTVSSNTSPLSPHSPTLQLLVSVSFHTSRPFLLRKWEQWKDFFIWGLLYSLLQQTTNCFFATLIATLTPSPGCIYFFN